MKEAAEAERREQSMSANNGNRVSECNYLISTKTMRYENINSYVKKDA